MDLMVQKIGTCLRLLINVVKLTPGPLYVSFKVCISQHHWKLFKSLPQHAFFFWLFHFLDDPDFCLLLSIYPGKNKRNEARNDDKCWWPSSCGRDRYSNRNWVSLETVSLFLP